MKIDLELITYNVWYATKPNQTKRPSLSAEARKYAESTSVDGKKP